jgi:hypothetical protein
LSVVAVRADGVGDAARVQEVEGGGAVQAQETGRRTDDEHFVKRAEAHVSDAGQLSVVLNHCSKRHRRQFPQPHSPVASTSEQDARAAGKRGEGLVARCHGVHGSAVVETENANAAVDISGKND